MNNLVAPALAKQLVDVGVAALTIHGRYGEQKFQGSVDYDGIAAVVDAAPTIPVFGNGDVKSPQDVATMIDKTGCAGVMIGRWALADPWIFRDSVRYLIDGVVPSPPTRLERLGKIVEHFENMRLIFGDETAVTTFRKRMPWYCKTVGPCPDLRRNMPLLQTVDEFYERIGRFTDEVIAGVAIPANHQGYH
jgi:tRNA-dihydrouridine synthase